MDEKRVLLFGVLLNLVILSSAERPCYITGIQDNHWENGFTSSVSVKDTFDGDIETFHANDTVQDAYIENVKYINVTIENGSLIISTTEEFRNYEENEEDTFIVVNISLCCTQGNDTLVYKINIEDTNNNDPKYERPHYNYTFYDKLPESDEINLNDFIPIMARDIDITNKKVTFEIETNEYFNIKYLSSDTNSRKNHFAQLSYNQSLSAPFEKNYTLTVTDDGDPTRNTTTLLTVNIIATIYPVFTESLYLASITPDQKVHVKNGPIAFIDDLDNVTITIESDYSDIFSVTLNKTVELKVTDKIQELLNDGATNKIILTLIATLKNNIPGKCSVIVTLSEVKPTTESDEISTQTENESDEIGIELTTSNVDNATLESVYVPLNGFNFWISSSTTFMYILLIAAAVGVGIGLIYLKLKLYH